MTDPIRIIITDDHMVVREGLAQVIATFENMVLIARTEDGEEALRLCETEKPDVVIMDIQMGGMGGIAATQAISAAHSGTHVIALSTYADRKTVQGMLAAGARAFLTKNIGSRELEAAIHDVMAGLVVISPDIDITVEASGTLEDYSALNLGAQQKKVLALLTKGLTNPEIASHLNVSVPTARYHVSAIFVKLGVSNRSEAVALAMRHDLVSENDI